MRASLAGLFVIAAACGGSAEEAVLFGVPGERTGLGSERCGPACGCGEDRWVAPVYTEGDVAALRSWTLVEPPGRLAEDPYARPAPAVPEGSYCAAMLDEAAGSYRLETFPSRAAAEAAGARPTHAGVCGLCSSLADLAVYVERPDLTEPVRACGLAYPSGPAEDHQRCLRELGFSEPCADIWYFNTVHTRGACLAPCLRELDAPYHLPDGSLNECLACDEAASGEVFKAIAGRTRRNTGVPSAMCRPCDEVERLDHRIAPARAPR